MNHNYLNLLINFTIFMLLISCMGLEEGRPSRVAIMNIDGEEVEELTLLQGMSYRLYPGVFLPDEQGEVFEGPAVKNPFLGEIEFALHQGGGLLTVGKEGCVMANATGLAQSSQASLELLADSIHKGILKTTLPVMIKPIAVGNKSIVATGVSDFSFAHIPQKKKKTH